MNKIWLSLLLFALFVPDQVANGADIPYLTGRVNDNASILSEAYAGRPFIRFTGPRVPQTRDVWGSNRCDIGWQREDDHLLLFSAIDNLVKGASGQAVQNMNLRFGIDEAAGLPRHGEL